MKIVKIGVRCFLSISNSRTVPDSNFSTKKANSTAGAKLTWHGLHSWHVELFFAETALGAEDST